MQPLDLIAFFLRALGELFFEPFVILQGGARALLRTLRVLAREQTRGER